MSVASLFTPCFVMFCVFSYGLFCHGAHKLDLSTLFTTFFLWTSPPFTFIFQQFFSDSRGHWFPSYDISRWVVIHWFELHMCTWYCLRIELPPQVWIGQATVMIYMYPYLFVLKSTINKINFKQLVLTLTTNNFLEINRTIHRMYCEN